MTELEKLIEDGKRIETLREEINDARSELYNFLKTYSCPETYSSDAAIKKIQQVIREKIYLLLVTANKSDGSVE
jgi:hypothetical protein